MKEVVVLLIAILGAASSKYLLVQLEDASEEWDVGIPDYGLVEDGTKHQSKYDVNRSE